MSAEILEFTTRRSKPAADNVPHKPRETLTITAKNERLRSARREAWRKADALANYWHALLRFTDAVKRVKGLNVKEARAQPEVSHESRWSILESYRDALGRHLLTPAPDVASVNWKQRHQLRRAFGVNKERVEKAIAEDVAFLDAHPTRNSRSSAQRTQQ
jgi:hypothetical protein